MIVDLGKPAPEGSARDAIHVAVVSVVAGGQRLRPGQRIHIDGENAVAAVPGNAIVDPWLIGHASPGTRVWAFMHPGTVTDLRHEWSHPDVGTEIAQKPQAEVQAFAEQAARNWIQKYISDHTGRSVEQTVEDAKAHVLDGSVWLEQGDQGAGYIDSEPEWWEGGGVVMFWECISILAGENYRAERGAPYQCCI